MNCYKIKIYCFRKAVIMPLPLLLPSSLLQSPPGWYVPLLCLSPFHSFWNMPQWQLVPPQSPSLSTVTYVLFSPSQNPSTAPPLTRPKSIHSYLCQTKSKSFMPFLGRRQLFFSQFYWHAAISVSWSLSKWTPSLLSPSSAPFPLSCWQRDPFYKIV